MEAEPSHCADGERSGRQQQPLSAEAAEPPTGSRPPQPQQPPSNPHPVHGGLGRLHHRKPKRSDLLLRHQHQHKTQAAAWQLSTDTPGPSGGSLSSPSTSSLPSSSTQEVQSQPNQEALEGSPSKIGQRKPQKPGKYVCTYCGRPCAKPSVLQKHIRSHTGERPYPCAPCGFSFKTKSNLYKHRKSHAHRIKAGLASSRDELSLRGPEMSALGEDPVEPTEGESTDSEEETGQYRKERLGKQKSSSSLELSGQEEGQRSDDSQVVKQRLAMRLSERKRGPMASPDDPSSSSTSSSLGPSSKGSQESGYFSLSRSAEMSRTDSQVSPPTANAKTYAEIILGKCGRLGGQQRGPHQQHAHSSSSGMEEMCSMPFSVPKTQVIEHITKLITINEAVVDTSEIDSVKPRRSSLSRKSSLESPKFSSPKDPYVFEPKGESPGPSGMAGQSFCPHVQDVDPSRVQEFSSSVPLLRSHSMPSSAGQGNSSTTSPWGLCRLSHSFDEQQAMVAEMRVGGQHRLLKRQPAIEVPLGAELILEEAGPSSSAATESGVTRKQQQQQRKGPRLYECEACGAHCKQRESYEAHRDLCTGQPIKELERREVDGVCREDRPKMMHYKFRALAMAVRKRRKEESLEEDPPSPGPTAVVTCSPTATTAVPSLVEQSEAFPGAPSQAEHQQQDRKGISVIQHTSSFEKQENISMESQESIKLRERQSTPQPKSSPATSRLVRQHNIQVPEILVTVDPDTEMVSVSPTSKEPERVVEEFQWPQRSQSLSQLPAEKLPPKKKRLRLAEAAAHSSGESSFESVSLGPRSPSQESNISHSPSRSASFEDMGGKPAEPSPWGSGSTKDTHMLTVPLGPYQHHQPQREMQRSASEQAPASPQQTAEIVETRSKSFDYGSLSPQQSASAWRERRKCLLVKHATLGEPDHEEGAVASQSGRPGSPKPGPSYTSHRALHPAEASTSRLSPEAIGKTVQLFHQPRILPFPMRPTGHDRFSLGHPVTTAISNVLSTHIIHRAFLQTHTSPPTIQAHPGQLHMAERLGLPIHPFSALLSLQYPSGAGQAVYLPVPPGLTIQVPTQPPIPSTVVLPAPSPQSLVPLPCHHPPPVIVTCLAQLTPVVSLVVPVRLHTHMPTYASVLYTTLSQILASARSQEPICCMAMVIMGQLEQDKLQRSYLKIPIPDFKSYLPLPLPLPLELSSASGEGYGPLGAGGSKRMLSPAASLELSTEAQRQQKRVKEEEEEEEEGKVGKEEENRGTGRKLEAGEDEEKEPERAQIGVVTVKVEEVRDPEGHREEGEVQGKAEPKKEKRREEDEGQGVSASFVPQSPERAKAPSYPSLHTTTSVSWCYLNYVKPNPSAQREPQTSVYTSWSVSVHNPNLPGLSTKLALSLLHSKQKHSSETYTMATALTPATGKVVPASNRKPHISEVHASPPSTPVEVKEPPQQPEKDVKTVKREEQGPSTSKQSEPLRVQIFEGGYKSNEEYVYVRGRGRGKYVCVECGIRCKKPSMLRKHIRTHTDVRPYVCKHCNFAFKTKGNLTKHMKSKAHGKKCQSMGTSGSSLDEPETEEAGGSEERLSGSEDQDEHQLSDVDDSEEDDDEDEEEEESSSHNEPPSSCSSDPHLSTGGHCSSERWSQQDTPDPSAPEPQPGPSPCPGLRAVSPLSHLRPLSPLQPMSPSQYRASWARAFPSPLGVQHRPRSSPSRLPWDIPSTRPSDRRQERIGTPSEWLMGPEPSLSFPPAFRLSPSDSPASQSHSMDHVFSHLPLHSQQARVPYLMIPIGGIQMVQARPRSHPSTPTSPPSPPMEGLLLGQTRREAPWCRTPRTQGLRTPGDHWSDSQEVVGASQSGLCIPSLTPPIRSKPSTSQQGSTDPGMINTKQYGSLDSSSHSHRSEAETTERWPSHGQAGPPP